MFRFNPLTGLFDYIDVAKVTIGGEVINGTAGSVLHIGSTGVLAEDNPGFTYIAGTGLSLDDGLTAERALFTDADFADTVQILTGSLGLEVITSSGAYTAARFEDDQFVVTIADQGLNATGINIAGIGISMKAAGQIFINNTSDQIALLVQGHSTQTNFLAVFEQSDGTDMVTISNAGELTSQVFDMPTTLSATVGVININNTRFMHSYSPGDQSNVFLGKNAGNFTLSGSGGTDRNVGIGFEALKSLTTGNNNVALGKSAGDTISSGKHNFALGTSAIPDVTSGNSNVAIGTFAGFEITIGDDNVMIGRNSAVNISGDSNRNTLIGSFTGTHGSGTNTVLNSNVFIGDDAAGGFQGTPINNVVIGQGAGKFINASGSVFIGYKAGRNVTTDNKLFIDNSSTATPLIGGDFSARTVTLDTNAFTIGTGADTDITFTFNANTNDGLITWREDEDRFDFADTVRIGGASNYTEIDNTGDVLFVGTGGLVYGTISVVSNANETTITTQNVYVQVTDFDTNGVNNNATPDHTNDHITITKAGDYKIDCCITVNSVAGAGATIELEVQKNNGASRVGAAHGDRTLSGGGAEAGAITICTIATLAVNDTIELWVKNESNTQNIIVEDASLSVMQVGG